MFLNNFFTFNHNDFIERLISTHDEVQKYCDEILSKASQEELKSYSDVIEYLDTANVSDNYEKTFIPVLIVLAKYAMRSGISNEDFNKYIERMRNNRPAGYVRFKGAGNVSKAKTIGRIQVIIDDFNQEFSDVEKPKINLDASRKKPVKKVAAAEKTVDKKEDVKSDDNIRVEGRAEAEVAVDVLVEAMNEAAEAGTSVSPDTSGETADAPTQTEDICQEGDADKAETEATVDVLAEAGTSVSPDTSDETADDAPT